MPIFFLLLFFSFRVNCLVVDRQGLHSLLLALLDGGCACVVYMLSRYYCFRTRVKSVRCGEWNPAVDHTVEMNRKSNRKATRTENKRSKFWIEIAAFAGRTCFSTRKISTHTVGCNVILHHFKAFFFFLQRKSKRRAVQI